MGLDLRLLPFDCDLPAIHYSHTILSCHNMPGLWDKILTIEEEKGKEVPEDFSSFLGYHAAPCEDHGYGKTTETPYEAPLLYVTAKDLCSLTLLLDDTVNQAIWAYLAQLPPQTKVALYWH